MTDFERIVRLLERHVSAIHARSVFRHALSEHRLSATDFKLSSLNKVSSSLERGLRLFTSEVATHRAMADVIGLVKNKPVNIEPCSLEIGAEIDISRARNAARQLCEQVEAKGFSIQKVTTIVSELARNIVSYTAGGNIELLWQRDPSLMKIRAIDRGPGISNLAHIMSGDYRSKTGLGRGLIGTKRLSDHFDIVTGPQGTRILSEVRL